MYNDRLPATRLNSPEGPREKLRKKGAGSLSNTELVAVLLKSGTKRSNVMQMARCVSDTIDRYGTGDLYCKLVRIRGMGDAKSLAVCAALEYARRLIRPSSRRVRSPQDIYNWLKPFCDKKQEHFIVFTLNGANEILNNRVVTIGLLNSSQVHPREVFSEAIVERAASIIVAHNHPSGIFEPSREDIEVTQKLVSAGKILGVSLLDHIIFGESGFKSFLEEGLI